jgi:hypothetical protein
MRGNKRRIKNSFLFLFIFEREGEHLSHAQRQTLLVSNVDAVVDKHYIHISAFWTLLVFNIAERKRS